MRAVAAPSAFGALLLTCAALWTFYLSTGYLGSCLAQPCPQATRVATRAELVRITWIVGALAVGALACAFVPERRVARFAGIALTLAAVGSLQHALVLTFEGATWGTFGVDALVLGAGLVMMLVTPETWDRRLKTGGRR